MKMNTSVTVAFFLLAMFVWNGRAETGAPNSPYEPASLYPPESQRVISPGKTFYYVDPVKGDDRNSGLKARRAWKSLAKVNALQLAPGDTVVIAPGFHTETLKPSGAGTAEKPVIIRFLVGRHEFGVENALRRPYFVSNSCDDPTLPRPVGILVEKAKHVRIEGGEQGKKVDIIFGGRMIQVVNDHSEDITYSGFSFDLKRPTVSEFRVMETGTNSVVIQIAEGSTYAITDGRFAWTGDLGPGWTMVQQASPENGHCWRMGQWNPFDALAEDLGAGRVRLTYKSGNMGIVKGRQFQFRNVNRDTVGAHNNRCRDIVFRDCEFHALTGMGFVSQYTENITLQRVDVAPPAGTIRTCPAWADCFHFSGCRGDILVDGCRFSGTQDDPINVHGTHLRIIGKTGDNQLHLRFMQSQTYGIAAFQPGDEVAVISHAALRERPGSPRRKVVSIEPKPGDATRKDWLLTLDGPVPEFDPNDVIDNVSWYPNITIRNCHVDTDSCRGFLITTRGKALVENCTFVRTHMSAILVEDDAEGWFESGPISDLLIRNNRFIQCGQDGSPVVWINPHNAAPKPEAPVHENIRIEGNFFDGGGISARSVKGLTVINNHSTGGNVPVNTQACSDVDVKDNQAKE